MDLGMTAPSVHLLARISDLIIKIKNLFSFFFQNYNEKISLHTKETETEYTLKYGLPRNTRQNK